jgi:hypothetical protein
MIKLVGIRKCRNIVKPKRAVHTWCASSLPSSMTSLKSTFEEHFSSLPDLRHPYWFDYINIDIDDTHGKNNASHSESDASLSTMTGIADIPISYLMPSPI